MTSNDPVSAAFDDGSLAVSPTHETGSDKLPLQLARQIEADVIRSGWTVGSSLGSEQELLDRYHVGRTVLRGAIRIVEHHQVATMRKGPHGGLVVTAPDASVMVDAMAAYLEFAGTTVDQVLVAKSIIEPVAAASAARTITEEGVARIRNALETPVTTESLTEELCNPLHSLLAELSGNAAIAVFVEVLNRLLIMYWNPASTPGTTAKAISPHSGLIVHLAMQ